jgi:CHASE3 domain sensor protein
LRYDRIHLNSQKEGTQMIRKAVLQIAAFGLLALIVFNAFLAVNYLKRIQKSATLTLESSTIQANIARVLQDLTDMETGQRGYLITDDPAYLQPYTDAKERIGIHFASLRFRLAHHAERERSLEAQLESLAGSKEAEMEQAISLRQQEFRHRAFLLVGTNEGKDYMDRARGILASLSLMESNSFTRLEKERNANSRTALRGTILANVGLLLLTACLLGLVRNNRRGLEQEAARTKRILAVRDSQLEKVMSGLSDQTRLKIMIIEGNTRLLLEKYGGFLPRQGYEYAEQIKEAAAQMERLRKELLGRADSNIDLKAA